ncbi:hypothetical protein GCM10027343_41540 [Noviherbaspirillum agri]
MAAASLLERSVAVRVAFAAAIGVAAVALQWLIQPFVGSRVPFLFFLPAVLLIAMLAGRVPALVVLAIGAINGVLLLPPTGEPAIAAAQDRVSVLIYVLAGSVLTVLGARLQSVTHRAAQVEQRLQLVQESSGVGMFEIDLEARTIFASTALAAMFGRTGMQTKNGLLALDEWNAPLRPEDLQAARDVLKQKLQEGVESYSHEHHMVLPDGQQRWFLSKVHIEKDHKGRAVRLRGATVDVTERKRMDDLLSETQAMLTQQVEDLHRLHELSSRLLELDDLSSQLRTILEVHVGLHGNGKGLLSLYDPGQDGLVVVASVGFPDSALQQLRSMIVGKTACGLAYAEKRRVVVEDTEIDPGMAGCREFAREQGFRAVHSAPLITPGGKVLGAISVQFPQPHVPDEREIRLTDICARKAAVFVERARAQASAIESERRFRVALDSSAVPFTVLTPVRDPDGKIINFRWTYANLAAARVLWRPIEHLIGRRVDELLPGSWGVPGLFEHFVAVADAEETREFELHSTPHGIDGWFHVVASPLVGSVAIWFADVTERKQHEQSLQEADRRKDEFLATLAHELRNPLAPIRQAALVSKSPLATEEQKRWSHDVIERQVRHMSLLLDDLLDVSRITRGMLHLRKEPVELAAVIDAAVETARPLIDAKKHALKIELPPEPVRFEADPLRLAQVVGNLLTNAAKYTDPGGIIQLQGEAADGEVLIRVSDNGIGIRHEALTEIFQMFTQVRSTQDRSGGGLGIGLALAKGLIELHGGSVVASSAGPGQGSRFTVRLPMRIAATPGVPADIVVPPQFSRVRKILVADDNRDAAETLAEFLRLQGHEVRVAYDGDAALAEFARFLPDVALLDIGMPGLDGNEVARRIRGLTGGADAMLIAITGWGQDKDRRRALSAGFDHHLTKPIDLQRLNLLLLDETVGPLPGEAKRANG